MTDYLYYYGQDVEQFTFFRLPKKLVRDKQFQNLSSDAKILYGILMDRMTLSLKNNWIDEDGRVYIIYRVTEIMDELGCSKRKSMTLLAELNDYGLIERKRQGLGKPNLIYVKNFNSGMDQKASSKTEYENDEKSVNTEMIEAEEEVREQKNDPLDPEGEVDPFQRCRNVHLQKCKNVHLQKCKDVHLQKCKDVHHINETEYNENNNINNPSIYPISINNIKSMPTEDRWTDRDLVLHTLHKKLAYDILICDMPEKKAQIREIFELMADVCCCTGEIQKLGDNRIRTEEFRKRFFQQMTSEHIRYVLQQLADRTGKIKNIRAYMLACLYNAPVSMINSYQLDYQARYEG